MILVHVYQNEGNERCHKIQLNREVMLKSMKTGIVYFVADM